MTEAERSLPSVGRRSLTNLNITRSRAPRPTFVSNQESVPAVKFEWKSGLVAALGNVGRPRKDRRPPGQANEQAQPLPPMGSRMNLVLDEATDLPPTTGSAVSSQPSHALVQSKLPFVRRPSLHRRNIVCPQNQQQLQVESGVSSVLARPDNHSRLVQLGVGTSQSNSSSTPIWNLEFNVPGGKLNRGMSVVDSVKILRGRALSDDEFDHKPCWYCVDGVGNIAINDAFMLEGAIYHLLKKHFRGEPYYVHLLELFHETSFHTETGQLVGLIMAPEDKADLSKFSPKMSVSLSLTHTFIVETAYYSFYLSVVALSILPLGEYFQFRDDFLDYVGTPEQIGKIRTDIVDNKCVNVALEVATPEQRTVLDANYGRNGAVKETKAIGLMEQYHMYEEGAEERIGVYGVFEQDLQAHQVKMDSERLLTTRGAMGESADTCVRTGGSRD
ncbi:Isoprenoid synthase domain containing protein [Tylopilus felleus]